MTRDELIEKMARTIWDKTVPGGYSPVDREESWVGWKSIFLKHAAAVLEVIEDNGMIVVPREPSPQMIEAGNDTINDNIDSWNYDSGSGFAVGVSAARNAWLEMISTYQGKKD